jgi:hypothetical protein
MADSKDDSKLFWSARQSRHLSAGDLLLALALATLTRSSTRCRRDG